MCEWLRLRLGSEPIFELMSAIEKQSAVDFLIQELDPKANTQTDRRLY